MLFKNFICVNIFFKGGPMKKLILLILMISFPVIAQFKPMDFQGYWSGMWYNSTFNTSDSAFITVIINNTDSSISLTMDLKGNIFAGKNPGPATMTGKYSDDGFDVSGNSPAYGDMFFSGDSAGLITGRLPDVPSQSVDSVIFNGHFDADSLSLGFNAYYSGATLATGYIKLNKDTSVVVPVELVSFSASYSGKTIELKWTTATEVNNAGFEIERSISNPNSGKRNPQWSKIGFVKGNGTTTEKKIYLYKDENVLPGRYLYRLKQIDFDGSFKYSDPVTVNISSPVVFKLDQNYPNPFNPVTAISYSVPYTSKVTISVYNLLGQLIVKLEDDIKDAGNYMINFNAGNLTSGVYIYSIQAKGIDGNGNFKSVKKMILLK